jgi:hypothetical protein
MCYSSACFKGELIDVVHSILRLVKSMNIRGGEAEYLHWFQPLLNKWICIFLNRIMVTLTQDFCTQVKVRMPRPLWKQCH